MYLVFDLGPDGSRPQLDGWKMAAISWFKDVEAAAPIEVFALTAAFNEDTHEKKVNLGVGGGLF